MDFQFSTSSINSPKICKAFDRPGPSWVPFTSSQNIVALSTTSPTFLASAVYSEITQEFTTMMLYNRQNCRDYEERKEKHFRVFTASPSTEYLNERNATRRGSSDTTTSISKTIAPYGYVYRIPYGDYSFHYLSQKSGCNIPVFLHVVSPSVSPAKIKNKKNIIQLR